MLRISLRCILLFFILSFSKAHAQQGTVSSQQLKAVFLLNFTRFIEWPPYSFRSVDEPFTIGIVNDNSLYFYLSELVASDKVNGHPIAIRLYKNTHEIKNCHLLFFGNVGNLREGLVAVKGKATLTVGDANEFCTVGGMIRFFTDANKMRFEINNEAAKESGLRISSRLLTLASVK